MIRSSLVVLCLFAMTISAEAQTNRRSSRVPGFMRRNTVSPYVNLGGRQVGLNNYFSIVRPQQQQQRFNQLQMLENRNLQQQIANPFRQRNGLTVSPWLNGSGSQQAGGNRGPVLHSGIPGVGSASRAAVFQNLGNFFMRGTN